MKNCGCPEWLGKCDYRYKSKCKNIGLCGYQTDPPFPPAPPTSGSNAVTPNPNYVPPASINGKKCNANSYGFNMFCDYKVDGNCVYNKDCCYQIEFKPSLEERAKQECSTCDHKVVCKFKDKFETMRKEYYPSLCVCQFYKKGEIIYEHTRS